MTLMKRPTTSNADEWQLYLQDGMKGAPDSACAFLAVQVVEAIEEHQRALASEVYALAEAAVERSSDLAMEDTPEGHYSRGVIAEAKGIARAINAIMPLSRHRSRAENPEKLKPCPFCGGEAELDTRRAYRNLSTGQIGDAVAIYCLGCSADMSACRADHSGLNDEDIIHMVTEMWNRRSTSAAVRGMREALEKIAGGHEYDEAKRDDPWWFSAALQKTAAAALSGIEPGEDEQATRASGPTAPTDRLQSKESSQ